MIKYKISDYEGKKIFHFTVLSENPCNDNAKVKTWRFLCECGKVVDEEPYRVISGHKKSCGCKRYTKKVPEKVITRPKVNPKVYIGQKSHRLTAVAVEKIEGNYRKQLLCLCECGNYTHVYPYQFASGSIMSCGCARLGHSECHVGKGGNRKHGYSKKPFYKKWNDMIRRCYSPQEPAYRFYGALGITVCEEWRDSPKAFIEWCEATYPGTPGLTIDRIDGSKGYSPDNCRWLTQQEQVHNLKNNRFITVNGVEKCVTEWCKTLGVSAGSVYHKVHKGSSFEEVISYYITLKDWKPNN